MGEAERKRRINEKKFSHWQKLPDGGRRYWYEVNGKLGFVARYIKEVDNKEITLKFYQKIYNSERVLVEIHEKFPEDLGHKVVPWRGK